MRPRAIALASFGPALAAIAIGCGDPAARSDGSGPPVPTSAAHEPPASASARVADAAPPSSAAPAPSTRPSASLDDVPEEMLRRGLLVVVPRSLTGPSPLLVFLHPEGMSGPRFAHDLGVETIAKNRGFAYATPDGARVSWQASKSAWGAGAPPAKQDEEIAALLTIARRKPNVDPERIYLVGWESGGFMAHHLACTVGGIRGIFSVGGAGPSSADPPCTPPGPVDVVEIHGTKDRVVAYEGGVLPLTPAPPRYPSAKETFDAWGERLGCTGSAPSNPLELISDLEGPETAVAAMQGCRSGARVELWTVQGGSHAIVTPALLYAILNFIDPARHE